MRKLIILFSLIIGLSSCTDFFNDERTIPYNQEKFDHKVDSLNQIYDHELGFWAKKYNFSALKSPEKLPESIQCKYASYKLWLSKLHEVVDDRKKAEEIVGAYMLWYISIGIGLFALRLITFRKKIVKKWLKLLYYSSITFLFWLGTSCYAFLFIKYPNYGSQSDVTFLTLSTQFKLIPFMIFWLSNTIYIGLIVLSVNRLFIHLFSFIDLEIKQPGYSGGKIKMDDNLSLQYLAIDKRQKMKDERLKNLMLYVGSSFVLLYLYYQNEMFSKLKIVRYKIAMESEGFSNYWFLLLITILFVIYYWAEGSSFNMHKKIMDEIDKNA